MQTIDGIINEPTVNFVGKDGFFWWIGEVEDNEDPMELGRVKVRVLGYYTNVRGGTTTSLPKESLPWATVLQHTSQAGNDGARRSAPSGYGPLWGSRYPTHHRQWRAIQWHSAPDSK